MHGEDCFWVSDFVRKTPTHAKKLGLLAGLPPSAGGRAAGGFLERGAEPTEGQGRAKGLKPRANPLAGSSLGVKNFQTPLQAAGGVGETVPVPMPRCSLHPGHRCQTVLGGMLGGARRDALGVQEGCSGAQTGTLRGSGRDGQGARRDAQRVREGCSGDPGGMLRGFVRDAQGFRQGCLEGL